MLQISLKVSSTIIPLHVYGRTARDVPSVKAKSAQVETFLRRMPAAHLRTLYPIFVVDRKPGGITTDGGYWTPGQVTLWLGREQKTGVPDADIRTYVLSRSRTGIIGMTATAWESPNFERALFHEIAHCLHTTLGILPEGATVDDYLGVPNPGANNPGELAAQAYQRFILGRMICQQPPLPADQSIAACTARVIQMLRRSPAFRSLPANWRPGDG